MATHSRMGTPWPSSSPSVEQLQISGVYLLQCPAQRIGYVGSSKLLLPRFRQHWAQFAKGVHPSRELQRIYDEHGVDALEYKILATMPSFVERFDRRLLALEGEWIMRLACEMTVTNIRAASNDQLFSLDGRFQLTRSRGRAYLLDNPHIIDKQIDLWKQLRAAVTR